MRLFIFLTLLLLTACRNPEAVSLKPMEAYLYPYDQLVPQKSFTYQRVGGHEQAIITLQIIERGGTKFLTTVVGDKTIKFDSAIANLDEPPRLVEIFRYEYDTLGNYQDMTKGTIEKEAYFANDTPYGGRKSHIKYVRNNIKTAYETIDHFKKDTVYEWNNVATPALYFERTLHLEVGHRYIPFLGKSATYAGYTIYAKALGIVKYANEVDGELVAWELISIE